MSIARPSVRPRGFTLIEMLVTVTIVALLSTIAFPMLELAERRSNERELREALRQVRTALDTYKQAVDEGRVVEETKGSGYPPNLDVLVNGVVDAKSPNKDKMIYFLRRIPRDPLNPPLEAGEAIQLARDSDQRGGPMGVERLGERPERRMLVRVGLLVFGEAARAAAALLTGGL